MRSSLSANRGVVGGSIALGSQNPESVRAIIGFAAGRGGHLNGKPNNNCAPNQLVDAVAEFGRTARVPMLWIYTHNDSYFGPRSLKADGGSVSGRRRQCRISSVIRFWRGRAIF